MASHNSRCRSVLVLTHNFPRYSGDISGVFLKHLLTSLGESIQFTVLAPHDKGLPVSETTDGIEIDRFRYAPDASETVAYRGEMHKFLLSKPLLVYGLLSAYRRRALQLARERSFDAIWAQWWIPGGWIGLKTGKAVQKPLIVTCHGTDIFLLNKFSWLRRIAAKVFSAADRITVVSSFLKDQLTSRMANRVADIEIKTVVAPMPVDHDTFFHSENVTPVPGTIICPSRLTTQKHVDKLIHAVSRLAAESVDCTVDIYGDGPEREKLERLVAELNLSERVRIHRPIPQSELADKCRKSEIAVLVSEREGFGLTLLEAMLCGCAGIGAKSGGITDIIEEDGVDGVLVTPGSVESLHIALRNLLTDRTRLERLRRSCLQSAVSRFGGDNIRRRFLDVLGQP